MSTKEGGSSKRDTAKSGKWKGKNVQYRIGRIIVKLKAIPEDSAETAESVCSRLCGNIPGGTVLRRPRANGRMLYSISNKENIITVAKNIERLPEVEYAEPDVIDHACVVPSDTRYPDQWGLQTIGMPAAWDLETGGSNVVIGIIDSGISMTAGALDHPDLNDASRYILGTDYVDGGTPRDLNGHKTHIAGIAAGESNNAQGIAGIN